ncbi:MAG: hypothetical protein ABH859_01110 [Pseudomonadota bacterium]
MPRIKICKHKDCQNAATTAGYCRLHYLKNWKKIKREEEIKAAKTLNSYIESVCQKHPDRYMEVIKSDIRSKNFEDRLQETFGYEEPENLFDDPACDEEITFVLKKLKIYKDY